MRLLSPDDISALKENGKVGLITVFIAFPPYVLVNHFLHERAALDLSLPIDRAFPFDHRWILVYAWVYVFIFLPVFIVKERSSFVQVAKSYVIMNFTSVAIFLLMPAKYARPEVPTQEEFLWWGTALNYILDKPVNCFPSLHVANAFFASMIAYHYRPRIGIIAWSLSATIGISTLYMKQHFLVDVLMGFALAFVVYRFYFKPRAFTQGSQKPLPEWLSFGVVAIYLGFVALMFTLFKAGLKLPLEKIVR